MIEPLPDFSRPFLLPRGGRAGLKIENGEHRTYLDDFVSGSARFSSAAFEAPSTAPFVKFAASSAAPSMASPV
jgi:hypothetical protein